MCMTKRNIADCVKQLSVKKPICKITIQDIMNETQMSRQSFYYHFKDIYDVLEWIGRHDFANQIAYVPGMTIEDWLFSLLSNLEENRVFYEKIVDEISWNQLAPFVRTPIEDCVHTLIDAYVPEFREFNESEYNGTTEIITTSICYDIMANISMRQSTNHQLVDEKLAFFKLIFSMPAYVNPTKIIA